MKESICENSACNQIVCIKRSSEVSVKHSSPFPSKSSQIIDVPRQFTGVNGLQFLSLNNGLIATDTPSVKLTVGRPAS